MLPSQYFQIMVWINVNVCCPLIFLVIFLCFVVRMDHIPVTYYINLLIFNLIQIIILMFRIHSSYNFGHRTYFHHLSDVFFLYCYSGVGSVCFRMIFAVERVFFIRNSYRLRNQQKIDLFSNYLAVITWINIKVCLPVTFLLIALCFLMRLDLGPVSYYMNLLFSNLIQLIILIALPPHIVHWYMYSPVVWIASICALVSLCFRMIIALERSFSISCPTSNCITQTKGFVIVSVLVWVLCIVFVPLSILLAQELSYLILLLLHAPVFVVCLLYFLTSKDKNISFSGSEICKIILLLLVLIHSYFVTMFSTVLWCLFVQRPNPNYVHLYHMCTSLYMTSFIFDFFPFIFMCKGFMRLCCCRTENPAGNDSIITAV